MKVTLLVLGCLLVGLTVLSRVRSARWWIRYTDFPRMQIAFGLALVLAAFLAIYGIADALDAAFASAVAGALLYQGVKIFPFTPLASKEVMKAGSGNADASIRILISNVLMENRRAGALLALVREMDPDILLLVETDAWWHRQLEVLDRDYPNNLKQPQGNHYGMHFFSRLELRSPEIRFLVESDIPSVRTGVRLRSGAWIEFYGVHPRPPEVQEDTEERDAEILIVGKQIAADGRPSIVAGDLNDVAWSHTTRLFQRISGTLDPRRGRGTFNTFHAQYPFVRWPLDHIFHEASFTLIGLQRLREIGSDHFPVFAALQYEPKAVERQEAPEIGPEDQEESRDRIAEGRLAAACAEVPDPGASKHAD
jgi:endonuclease/exonuclease/phosphatase (EEP) superfamily protein YafD